MTAASQRWEQLGPGAYRRVDPIDPAEARALMDQRLSQAYCGTDGATRGDINMATDDDRKRIYDMSRDYAIQRTEHAAMERLREMVKFRSDDPDEIEANHTAMIEVIQECGDEVKRLEDGRP